MIFFNFSRFFFGIAKGRLYSWGSYSHSLGRKVNNKEDARNPGEVTGFYNKLLQIAVGYKHVLALDTEGKIYSWGKNDCGQVK